MSEIYKFFRNLSIIIFLVMLLATYAYLPRKTGLLFEENGRLYFTITKHTFFYGFLGLFLLVQVIFYSLQKFLLQLHTRKSTPYNSQRFTDWIRCFNGVINIFIILVCLFIGLANNPDLFTFKKIIPLLYLGVVMILACLIWLLFILIGQRAVNQE